MTRSVCFRCMVCVACLLARPAWAALVDQDWITPGDANLLLDTDTGYEWLDLSVTADQSYLQVASELDPGGAYEGFRFATQGEVLAMWSHGGISNTHHNWVMNGEWPAVSELVDRLGPTSLFEPGSFGTHALGMVEGGSPLPSSERWVMELAYDPDGVSTRTSDAFYTFDINTADHHYSSYLVRTAVVPLPGAIWLFAPGLLSLWAIGRRRGA